MGNAPHVPMPTESEVDAVIFDYQLNPSPALLNDIIHVLHVVLGDRGDALTHGDRSRDTPERTHARHRLGWALVERFRRTGDRTSLEWGLRHQLDALAATPRDSPRRSTRLREIADGLLSVVEQFQVGEAPELARGHLANIVGWLEESVELSDEQDADLPWRLSSLGTALRLRFDHFGDEADADAAVDALRRADTLAESLDQEARAGIRANLAQALFSCALAAESADELGGALALWREAADLAPPGSRSHAAHLQNYATALTLVGQRDSELAARARDAASRGPQEFGGSDITFLIVEGDAAAADADWAAAIAAYGRAQDRIEEDVRAQVTRRFRTRLVRDAGEVAARLAHALAREGETEAAVTALERGRAVLLADALVLEDIRASEVRDAGRADLADELEKAVARVRSLETAGHDPSSGTNLAGGEGEHIVRRIFVDVAQRIRAETGIDVVAALPFGELASVTRESPLAYVAATPEGGLTVVVHGEEVRTLFLPELTDEALSEVARAFVLAGADRRSNPSAWLAAIDSTCRWLWDVAAAELVGAAASAGSSMTVVPCGSLGYLPLHAAWTPDTGRPTGRRYALDEVAFAYAPNARAHNAAHRGTGRPLLAAPLVVSGGTGLPAVGREAAELASLLPGAQVLTGGAATPNAVLSALRDCTLAHVGSHAASNPTEPLSSRIDLEGGPLQAHRLPGARLTRARLVVLSACETAVVGRDAPDEAVGISTALLQAGATGVIASLWAVPDEPTALLVRELYRGLLADGRHPHVALRDAQVRLRDATNAELAAEDADAALRDDPLWRTSQRYAHPYNWAAFTYAGA